ncbi:MAG: carbamoyltransferase HypF [Candidatus Latescibacterota bacterium]|nr:MAG: carbamoyltransferase HypF [Candidatus Latescibacterota bacterium]
MNSGRYVASGPIQRLRITIRGVVQGVGFRPFVYRLATELGLKGFVVNSPRGVFVEVEGEPPLLDTFFARIQDENPQRSYIQSLEHSVLDPIDYDTFDIRESDSEGEKIAPVLPDIATCSDCISDIFDPQNRRYRYPFTNCTNCGPRYSVIEALPYDRPNTSMKSFEMCWDCRTEYEDPMDRRFHAQPTACPVCGPRIELWDTTGRVDATQDEALSRASGAIRDGAILALKGLGGFHLIVDARDESAVRRLRERKHRNEKPLALMYPSLELVNEHCQVSPLEKRLLTSPEAPIVLLRRRPSALVAPSIAPANPYLGVMIPYTPLHHLLVSGMRFPIVATSGNLSEEPICIDETEALDRLGAIADLFLVHNRPIVRHVDDSVVRLVANRVLVLRRARGYAPLPVPLKTNPPPGAILGVGGHLKNTVAISVNDQVFLSQHIGDMSTNAAYSVFRKTVSDLQRIYVIEPERIACDAHPDYRTTKHVEAFEPAPQKVQHHWAHVLSCMAENELEPPVCGVSWDGTGFGPDKTIWGGEFLRANAGSFERVGHLRRFSLPGGEQAVREPRRAALGLLYEIFSDDVFDMDNLTPLMTFSKDDRGILRKMLRGNINSPLTSSAGRLFDAVASLLSLRHRVSYEGQAAMELEFATWGIDNEESYPFDVRRNGGVWVVDWEPLTLGIMSDIESQVGVGSIATKFHNTLAELITETARRVNDERVVLTGGCFQNKYLTERTIVRLMEAGFRPYWHQRVPPNDGGIALGQVVAAALAKSGGE